MSDFKGEVQARIAANGNNEQLQKDTRSLLLSSTEALYSYNFSWLGRPIIQYPQDMVALQELIWQVKPDLIIETGIAHGGSIVMSASILALLDYCDAVEQGRVLDPAQPTRRVIGIDIDVRPHNRQAIDAHPMANRIDMIEGSSIDAETIDAVHKAAGGFGRIMVILDSNHTHDHVLAELEAYAPLTSKDSYCIIFDTVIEDLPERLINDERPWCVGNNPKTAVWEYLDRLKDEARTGANGDTLNFEIDKSIEDKLLVTYAPDGYLKRIS